MSGMLVNVFSTTKAQILFLYSNLEAKSMATAPPVMEPQVYRFRIDT